MSEQSLTEVPDGLAAPFADPIARRSLHDQVVDRLRDMIVEGELASGERVRERLLCERLGVSRTPLREALKVLASEGMVELLPHRGAKVAALTVAEVEELFQVIGALEALAGELACHAISTGALDEIAALHQRMLEHHQAGARSEYFKLNQRIHERIVAAAGNATLARAYQGLSGRLRRYRYLASDTPGRWTQAAEEHGEILVALSARDGPRLSRILKLHLHNKCEAAKAALRAAGGHS